MNEGSSQAPPISERPSNKESRQFKPLYLSDSSERLPTEDLGSILDAILSEHTTTLQTVINNIKQSRTTSANDREDAPKFQSCKQRLTYPIVSPRAAEPLNVGEPGQVKVNLNDSPTQLWAAVNSMEELIDLINSVADDHGFDLRKRPSREEDRVFFDAPFER